MTEDNIKKIVSRWGIDLFGARRDLALFGSPERTEFRVAFEDDGGNVFVLEQVLQNRIDRKATIAEVLYELKGRNDVLEIFPYLSSASGKFLEEFGGAYWQVVRYIDGVPLDRRNYLNDGWRGVAAADFLEKFKRIVDADDFQKLKKGETFDLQKYVLNMKENIAEYNKREYALLEYVFDELEKNFFIHYENLPVAFCHGDYHPLNIIWSEKGIAGVIDWEFCGIKPELYDVANMVGCLGMEHPDTLKKKIVTDFIGKLREKNMFSQTSWNNLIYLIVANRFGWLSEWLRKNDQDMIGLEICYMKLLLNGKDALNEAWGI